MTEMSPNVPEKKNVCADSEADALDEKFVENLRIEDGSNEGIAADGQSPILVGCLARDHHEKFITKYNTPG